MFMVEQLVLRVETDFQKQRIDKKEVNEYPIVDKTITLEGPDYWGKHDLHRIKGVSLPDGRVQIFLVGPNPKTDKEEETSFQFGEGYIGTYYFQDRAHHVEVVKVDHIK